MYVDLKKNIEIMESDPDSTPIFFPTRKLRGSNWTSKQPKAFSTTSECEELLHGKVEKRSFESFPYNN